MQTSCLNNSPDTLMLSVHPAVNPEVQGSKHAVDIFQTFFTDDHMWEHQRRDRMGHAPNLHKGQVHILVLRYSSKYAYRSQNVYIEMYRILCISYL